MTLHIQIDRETEKQLAAIASLEKLSVEDVAAAYLKDKIQEREAYLDKVRTHLSIGEAQADRGEFADYSLEGLISELDNEPHEKS